MSVSFSSNVVTISGSTEGGPDTLAGIVAAVADATKCRMDNGFNFWIGGGIASIDIQGWLKISDGQSFQCDSIKIKRSTSGAGIIFEPRSRWVLSGTGQGYHAIEDNGFGTNFNVVCKRDAITGDVPLWVSQRNSRDDTFGAFYDTSGPAARTPRYRIEGVHLFINNASSLAFYPQANSDPIRYLSITALTSGVEFQTCPSATADSVFSDATFAGFKWMTCTLGYAGRKIRFERLRMNYWENYDLEYVHWYGNTTSIVWEFEDFADVGAGSWTGQVKRTAGGANNTADELRFAYTDKRTFLAGATAIQDVNTRWVSSNATDAPAITAASNANGETGTKALLKYLSKTTDLAAGATFAPTAITWSLYARKYQKDTQPEWALYENKTFTAAGSGAVQMTVTEGLTDSQATADAITGVSITDNRLSPVTWNGKNYSWTVTGNKSVNAALTAKNIWTYLASQLSKQTTLASIPGLQLPPFLRRLSDSDFQSIVRSGDGVRIIDQTGAAFPDVSAHYSDDGTAYVPPVTITRGLAFTGIIAGSFVRVVQTSDASEKFLTTSSGISETWSESSSGSLAVSYMVMKAGYEPIGPITVTVTGATSGGVLSVPVSQVPARWYQASSGLTINTNAFANAGTKKFGLTTASTLQNFASYLLEQWIVLGGTGGAFANKPWPLAANGPNSFTWGNGWEADLTTYPNTIINLSRDGMRYLDGSGTTTAQWCALLSGGVSAGMQVRYQQTDGGTTNNAAATGNIDQLIQIYGDATHGNFDRRGYMVAKVQESGYDQAEVDVVAQYGTLEDQLYVIALAPTANGVAAGNPSITNPPTITDHAGVPVAWNGGAMSITITDSAAGNTGTGIMRWLRYYFETGGTFQGKDAFNWHDLVQTNGNKFKTVRGKIYGDTGATLKGVRVLTNAGTAHPDFNIFTFDDGTTYSPPPAATVTISGLTNGSRVQLYDTLNSVELYNSVITGTSLLYSETYSVNRTVRVRVTYVSGTTAKEMIEATVGSITSSAPDISYIASQTNDVTYNTNAIDGSTVTNIAINDTTDRVEIAIAGGSVTWGQIYAYQVYWLNTSVGIRDDFAFIKSPDTANYILTNFKVKNTHATNPLTISGGWGRDTGTGLSSTIIDTASTSNIYLTADHVIPYATGSGVTSQDKVAIAAEVLLQAQSAPIYSDARKMNGATILGNGTAGNKWRGE